jgi:prepilin-type processing-associated H-X9-DG protein
MDTSTSSSDRDPLERLAAEFLDRRRRGENPSPSEYAEQYPQWADQIREFFPALELMEGLKPATGDRTASVDDRAGATGSPHPEQLGEYRILREIGHGGMGHVFAASSLHPGGVNFAFADGSVRFLKDTIQTMLFDQTTGQPNGITGDFINYSVPFTMAVGTQFGVYQKLSTRNGGEVISASDY